MTTPALHHELVWHPGRMPILYLHGFTGCGDDWQPTIELLGDAYSHLIVDLPGHGQSFDKDADPSTYSMSGCAKQLVALLDSLDISSCHVVGYSMGGRLALYLAVHHAARFDRFVIESGSPGLKTESERAERRRRDADLADSLRTRSLAEFLTNWYNQPLFATADQSSDAFKSMIERRLKNNSRGLALSLEHMGTGSQPSLWDTLYRITTPVLFVAGDRDHKFNQLAAQMAHLCPGGRLAILAGAGHIVHVDQPDAFTDHVRSFLSGD